MRIEFRVTEFRTARCLLSGKQAECLICEFEDGTLRGPISLKSLEKLLHNRAEDDGEANAQLFGQQPAEPFSRT